MNVVGEASCFDGFVPTLGRWVAFSDLVRGWGANIYTTNTFPTSYTNSNHCANRRISLSFTIDEWQG